MSKQKSVTEQPLAGWAMALPAFALISVFLVLPFLMAFGFSLTNQRLISPNPTEYVGFQNYARALDVGFLTIEPVRDAAGDVIRDDDGEIAYPRLRTFTRNNPDYPHLDRMRAWFSIGLNDDRRFVVLARDVVFMKALRNTIVFVAIVAPLQAFIALGLAMLVNMKLRGVNFFRTVYFMPVVISMVVVSVLWRFIYDGENGLLNAMLGMFSFGVIAPVDWLGNTSTALPSIIAMSIWQGVGFHMVIWLSGLQTIPGEQYEAARIEGATRWQTFRYVTWPGLRNTAILVMVIITMQAFTLYPQVEVMTRGGPLDSTQSLVFQMVIRGYEKQDIAGGSVISVLLFLIVLSISLVQRYLTREKD